MSRFFANMQSRSPEMSPGAASRDGSGRNEDVDEFLRSSGSSSSSSGARNHIFAAVRKKRIERLQRNDRRRSDERQLSLQQLRRYYRQQQQQQQQTSLSSSSSQNFHNYRDGVDPLHRGPHACFNSFPCHNHYSSSSSSTPPLDDAEARVFRILGTAHIVCGAFFMLIHILEAIFVQSQLLFAIWIGFFYVFVGVMCIFHYVKWTLTLSLIVAISGGPLIYFRKPKEICDDSRTSSSSLTNDCNELKEAALRHSCIIFIFAEMVLCVAGVVAAISVLVRRHRRVLHEREVAASRASRSHKSSTGSSAYYLATAIDPTATIRDGRRDRNREKETEGRIETDVEERRNCADIQNL